MLLLVVCTITVGGCLTDFPVKDWCPVGLML
jgi:hypothetical protein